MSWPRKSENQKCPKCNKENVYVQGLWTPPAEKDLEEGKIIAGIIVKFCECHSCRYKWNDPDMKVYSEDIII